MASRKCVFSVLCGWFLACVFSGPVTSRAESPNLCLTCHSEKAKGFAAGHGFGKARCRVCHGGNAASVAKAEAHAGLIAFPGNLSNAERSCGRCHPERVASVIQGFMSTGKGMVSVTRFVFGEQQTPEGNGDFSRLSDSPADVLLRKLCASCHLGQEKTRHAHGISKDRGGGCLACHINAYPKNAHPGLTARVRDERCFGCHSRSSRIALNYTGLAEVDDTTLAHKDVNALAYLDDGRLVQIKSRDSHHQAGMACIDCHTSTGLMGSANGMHHQREAVDIACDDCHRNQNPRVRVSTWPEEHRPLTRFIPFPTSPDQAFLTTASRGTPLWHIELRTSGYFLHRKLQAGALKIPQYTEESHPLSAQHARLTCAACHSQWAPQCYGCHTTYNPAQRQWDHVKMERTPGRWVEKRWGVRNALPTLGVTAENEITPFIPGMILTIDHPDWKQAKFQRLFASTSPHTTGRSRSCASCHHSSTALGLGQGELQRHQGAWAFKARFETLVDGLPADAWTTLGGKEPGRSTRTGDRSFTQTEIVHILDAVTQP